MQNPTPQQQLMTTSYEVFSPKSTSNSYDNRRFSAQNQNELLSHHEQLVQVVKNQNQANCSLEIQHPAPPVTCSLSGSTKEAGEGSSLNKRRSLVANKTTGSSSGQLGGNTTNSNSIGLALANSLNGSLQGQKTLASLLQLAECQQRQQQKPCQQQMATIQATTSGQQLQIAGNQKTTSVTKHIKLVNSNCQSTKAANQPTTTTTDAANNSLQQQQIFGGVGCIVQNQALPKAAMTTKNKHLKNQLSNPTGTSAGGGNNNSTVNTTATSNTIATGQPQQNQQGVQQQQQFQQQPLSRQHSHAKTRSVVVSNSMQQYQSHNQNPLNSNNHQNQTQPPNCSKQNKENVAQRAQLIQLKHQQLKSQMQLNQVGQNLNQKQLIKQSASNVNNNHSSSSGQPAKLKNQTGSMTTGQNSGNITNTNNMMVNKDLQDFLKNSSVDVNPSQLLSHRPKQTKHNNIHDNTGHSRLDGSANEAILEQQNYQKGQYRRKVANQSTIPSLSSTELNNKNSLQFVQKPTLAIGGQPTSQNQRIFIQTNGQQQNCPPRTATATALAHHTLSGLSQHKMTIILPQAQNQQCQKQHQDHHCSQAVTSEDDFAPSAVQQKMPHLTQKENKQFDKPGRAALKQLATAQSGRGASAAQVRRGSCKTGRAVTSFSRNKNSTSCSQLLLVPPQPGNNNGHNNSTHQTLDPSQLQNKPQKRQNSKQNIQKQQPNTYLNSGSVNDFDELTKQLPDDKRLALLRVIQSYESQISALQSELTGMSTIACQNQQQALQKIEQQATVISNQEHTIDQLRLQLLQTKQNSNNNSGVAGGVCCDESLNMRSTLNTNNGGLALSSKLLQQHKSNTQTVSGITEFQNSKNSNGVDNANEQSLGLNTAPSCFQRQSLTNTAGGVTGANLIQNNNGDKSNSWRCEAVLFRNGAQEHTKIEDILEENNDCCEAMDLQSADSFKSCSQQNNDDDDRGLLHVPQLIVNNIESAAANLQINSLAEKRNLQSVPPVSVPKLDLRKLASADNNTNSAMIKACYQTEFMAHLNDCSKSWREAALKDHRT